MAKAFLVDVSRTYSQFPSDKRILRFVISFCVAGLLSITALFVLSALDILGVTFEGLLFIAIFSLVVAFVVSVKKQSAPLAEEERRHTQLIKNQYCLFTVSETYIDILEESLRRDNFMLSPSRGWAELPEVSEDYRRVQKEEIKQIELLPAIDENHLRFLGLRWSLHNGKSFLLNVQNLSEKEQLGAELRLHKYPFTSLVKKYP